MKEEREGGGMGVRGKDDGREKKGEYDRKKTRGEEIAKAREIKWEEYKKGDRCSYGEDGRGRAEGERGGDRKRKRDGEGNRVWGGNGK